MLFTFDQLACFRRLFPATTWLAFQTPRTEMGPLRLLKTSEPGSLSHICTTLFWVYLLRLILKEYKRQDRSHVTTDGQSVRPCVQPLLGRTTRFVCVEYCCPSVLMCRTWRQCESVHCCKLPSFSVVYVSYFPHSQYIQILRRSRPHTQDYTLGSLALSVTTASSIEQSSPVSEHFTLQTRSNSSCEKPAALKGLRCSSYLSAFFVINYAKNAWSELSAILMAGVSYIKEWWETYITHRTCSFLTLVTQNYDVILFVMLFWMNCFTDILY